MATNCPNKNLQDWKDLVSMFGKEQAYFIYMKNGEKVPYLQNRVQNRFVWDAENALGLVTWTRDRGTNVKGYKGFDRYAAEEMVNRIRNEYVGDYEIRRVKPDGKGEFGLQIVGMPLLKSEFEDFQREVDMDEAEALENFEIYKEFEERKREANEDILPLDTYERKIMDLKEEPEEQTEAGEEVDFDIEKFVSTLKRTMPYVEVIIQDSNLQSAGELLAGGKKIVVNPDYFTGETLGHEYGHLLIDLRGGMSDPFILDGYNQIKDTPMALRVREEYEGYLEERIQKEILAEAIGKKAVDMFQEMENKTLFERWLLRFFRWLGTRLGIKKDNVRELARELVGDKAIDPDKFKGSPAEYIQERKKEVQSNKRDEVAKAIQDYSNKFKLSDDGTHYTWDGDETIRFERVSQVMNEYGFGIRQEEENEKIRRGQRFGTVIHLNAEMAAKGAEMAIEDETGFEMTPRAFGNLKSIVKDLFGEESTILTEVVVGDPKIGIAGTVDVLVIDKEGKVHMYDYKTKEKYYKEGKREGEYKGFAYYESPYYDENTSTVKKTQKEVNSLQLSIYREILKKNLGLKVDDMYIVQLVGDTFETGGKEKIKTVELETVHSDTGIIPLKPHGTATTIYKDRLRKASNEAAVEKGETADLTDEEISERKEELKNLELLSTIKDEAELIREKALSIAAARIRRDKHNGNVTSAEEMSDLAAQLLDENVDNRIAIANFANNAVKAIYSLHSDYMEMENREKRGDDGAFTIRKMYKWHETLKAYDVLDDVASMIVKDGFQGEGFDKSTTSKMLSILNDAINKKNIVKNAYRTKGEEMMVKELSRYSTRIREEYKDDIKREWIKNNPKHGLSVDKLNEKLEEIANAEVKKNAKAIVERTKIMLRAEMQTASTGDISVLGRWLDTVLDSNDMVMAAMVKKFVVADRMGRSQYVNMKNQTVELLKELEKYQGHRTFKDPVKMYGFMLEVDDNGDLTGHYISDLKSGLFEAHRKMMRDTEHLPPKERGKKRSAWMKENMPEDTKAKEKALDEYLLELVEEGKMTEKQYNKYWSNYKKPYKQRVKISKFLKYSLADDIHNWHRNNRHTFLDKGKIPEKWKNKEWDELSKILENENDPRAKFYNFIVEKATEADSYLPLEQRLGTRLPAIMANTLERIASGEGVADIAKDAYADAFKRRADDSAYGTLLTDENDKPIDYVPIHYTRNATWSTDEQSYDLASIYSRFYAMASNYKHKSEILPEMELTQIILQNREYAQYDGAGKKLVTAIDSLGEKELTKKGINSYMVAQFEDFKRAMLYGQEKEPGKDVDFLGLKFNTSKAADKLGNLTSFNLMGLNIIQGFSNVSMGEIQQVIEARASQYFNLEDLRDATTTYLGELGDIMGDIGSRKPESKIGLLNEEFDILNEYEGGDYNRRSRFANLMRTSTLFFQANVGEHFLQTRVMIAMLKKVKAYNEAGEEIGNMYDMYEVKDGILALNEEVSREKSNWSKEQEILFGEKTKRLLADLHGEYSQLGKNAVQRYAAGRLAMMFRKFVIPGYKRRWSTGRYNEFLTTYKEGSYVTTWNYLTNVVKELKTLGLAAASENWNKLLPREKSNILRAVGEVGASVIMSALMYLFVGFAGDLDDDSWEQKAAYFAGVVFGRTKAELRFYLNPLETMTILRSPTAAMSIIENTIRLVGQILENPFEVYERGNWEGNPKVLKRLVQLVPAVKQIYRIRDIEDTATIFMN